MDLINWSILLGISGMNRSNLVPVLKHDQDRVDESGGRGGSYMKLLLVPPYPLKLLLSFANSAKASALVCQSFRSCLPIPPSIIL